MNRPLIVLVSALSMMAATSKLADGIADNRLPAYEYTADEVNAAAAKDLDSALAPLRLAGKLNRHTPEFERVHRLFDRMTAAAKRRSDFAGKLDWAIYVHEGRIAEAYSRAGGKIVISASFLERYRPSDAELAFVISHEIAHSLCEHERMNLSAVWRRNAPQRLPARYAMEFIDTEPMVRALFAPSARLQERIADRLGLELAAAAGIDPISALDFFDKSADEIQGGLFPDVHDAPAERKASLLQGSAPLQTIAAMFRGAEMNCAP